MTSSDPGAAPPEEPRRSPLWRALSLAQDWGRAGVRGPVLLVVPALAAGLLLAPQLATRSYPTDPSLLGTPALGNIKAPHDIDVVDEETTQRLREEAVSQVRRVYDYDVQLGDKLALGVEAAFTMAHDRLGGAEGKELLAQAEALLPEIERLLGTTLRPEEASLLAGARYAPEVGAFAARAVREGMSQPMVASRAGVEADRQKGLTLQRVPDQGGPTTHIDVEQLHDLEALRKELGHRLRRAAADLSPQLRDTAVAIAARLLEPNVTFNRAATELEREVARLSVKPVTLAVKKGEMVLRDGERLTRRHLLIFGALSQARGGGSLFLVALGAAVAVLVLVGAALLSARRGKSQLNLTQRDLVFLVTVFVAVLAAARGWVALSAILHEHLPSVPQGLWLVLMPIAAAPMIVRLVVRVEIGIAFAVVASLMVALMVEGERFFALYAVVGSVLGATLVGTMSARGDLVRAGVRVGVGQAVAALAMVLFGGAGDVVSYLGIVPAAFACGVLAGLVALALTPVVEAVFGYTTDLKLLELANLNHPALKELIVQAPGSYHHSVIVGSLVEAAAESIGANPLLARVMAYYHDLGKGCNPGYFIENQRAGQNPHDNLKPSLSAMIIRRHVTDGLELARKHRLGEAIQAGIAEHHGTTLIHFFFHKAKENEDEQDPVSESDYRYPGRKPQSREAALVMLGDSVEAASRSLAEPTTARLNGLVQRIINIKFTDGQLDECDLTLKDLHQIAKAFSRVLGSIYHQRPEYPELLGDLSGKKKDGDSDSKPPKKPKGPDAPPDEPRPDNLRRLGLS